MVNDLQYAVYLRARAYWNTRFNDIHVPLAYLHARTLLLAHPAADANIVIPAIFLHDIGWTCIPEDQHGRAFAPEAIDEAVLRRHELEGARIANEILLAVGYNPQQRETIVRIIDGHDSRRESLSLEDSIVKDADKVWRYTPVGIEFHWRQFHRPLPEHVAWLGSQVERWFFTARGKRMAREALADAERSLAEVGHV